MKEHIWVSGMLCQQNICCTNIYPVCWDKDEDVAFDGHVHVDRKITEPAFPLKVQIFIYTIYRSTEYNID